MYYYPAQTEIAVVTPVFNKSHVTFCLFSWWPS